MTDPDLSPTEEPPPDIPGYQILEAVGEGGTGRVYRAVQLSLGRAVAVKVLHPAPDSPAGSPHHEPRLMATLAHPNLVTVFDCGRAAGRDFIVTELVPGPTLRPRLVAGEPWPVAQACALLDRIARAIGYIHARGILHLDLKPENILIGADGEPKITDFGLALAGADAGAAPAAGTIDYSAPEQRFGLPTSERTDLFSLAVLAYELLTGHLPARVYAPARELNPRLPAAVDRVLRRALARSPEDRPATVDGFRRELIGALTRGGGSARRRLLAVGSAALVIGAAAFLADWQPPQTAATPAAVAQADPVEAWLLYDHPDQLPSFDVAGPGDGGFDPRPVLVRGRGPSEPGGPPVPVWPNTRPLVVVESPGALGFVHPGSDPALGRRVVRDWRHLVEAAPVAPGDNLCRAGDFAGDCLAFAHGDEVRPWRALNAGLLPGGDTIAVATPADRPGNPALRMVRRDPLTQGQEFGCYQWLARIPDREGTVVVLRYRARADDGDGRLAIRVQLPLLLPAGGEDEAARRLRAASVPLPDLQHRADEEPRQYRLEDWVTPGPEWKTYFVVWEWPAYCQDPGFRNLVVFYAGTGAAWVDDVEVFTWELGGVP